MYLKPIIGDLRGPGKDGWTQDWRRRTGFGRCATNRGCGCGVAAMQQEDTAALTPTPPRSTGVQLTFICSIHLHLFARSTYIYLLDPQVSNLPTYIYLLPCCLLSSDKCNFLLVAIYSGQSAWTTPSFIALWVVCPKQRIHMLELTMISDIYFHKMH